MFRDLISAPDLSIQDELQQYINNLNKPLGALGRLEEIALQIGLIQQTTHPELHHPCHLLFGADHGIQKEGVSASPREITWQQMINFTQGGGGVNLFCRQHQIDLTLIDVGVDYDLSDYPTIHNHKIARGTENFRYTAAMTVEEMENTLVIGATYADTCYHKGCNIISFGEMGIGNTSASALWMHFFGNHPLEECIGAGSGLNEEGIRHKYEVLDESARLFRHQNPSPTTLDIIRWFGGFEMVATVGAMLQAASRKMVILVDGFIMSACMQAAMQLAPSIRSYAIFCHEGDEKGHRLLLQDMQAQGLLNLGLRLGEGTGALCAYPIIVSAVEMMHQMKSFEQSKITKYF